MKFMKSSIFKPDFLQIPIQLYEDPRVEPADRDVYAVVYWFEHLKDGKCTASNKTIAEVVNLTPRSVQNSLTKLEQFGYIDRLYKDSAKRNRSSIIAKIALKHVRNTGDRASSSEVLVTPERSVGDRHERSVGDQNKNILEKNRNTAAKPQGPFNWQAYLRAMDDHKSRHVQVIAFYFKKKKISYDTLAKAQVAIRRHLRSAKEVANFSDKEIVQAYEVCDREYREKYTIETLLKVLTR